MNRSQAGKLGAHAVHARGKTNTVPARMALEEKFRLEVDPHGVLSDEELAKRLKHAKSAYYQRLAARRWG